MEHEDLQILAEECAEVQVAISKIIRFGITEQNMERLKCELGDLQCLIDIVKSKHNILDSEINLQITKKKEKLSVFSSLFKK
jgi:NTP pyrophosphatase (non-canonical NTP hydrolase)